MPALHRLKFLVFILLTACTATTYNLPKNQFIQTRNGKPLLVPHAYLPLACIGDKSVTFEDYEQYRAAAHEYNEAVGVELFQEYCTSWIIGAPFPTQPVEGMVLVHIGIPIENMVFSEGTEIVLHKGASVPTERTGGGLVTIGLTVTYTSTRNPDETYGIMLYIAPERRHDVNVWRHELGHIVGLDHDKCCKDSIMYPIIQDTPGTLLQEDIDALKSAYYGFPY